jgi:hypothetical protein
VRSRICSASKSSPVSFDFLNTRATAAAIGQKSRYALVTGLTEAQNQNKKPW